MKQKQDQADLMISLRKTLTLAGALLLAVAMAAALLPSTAQGQEDSDDDRVGSGNSTLGPAVFAAIPAWLQVTDSTASGIDRPRGVAIDPATGQLFVADRDGGNIFTVSVIGEPELLVDFMADAQPQGVTVANGELFVAEESGDRVSVWTVDGAFKRAWGTPGNDDGQFNEPCDVEVSPTNEIFVADANNNRVQVFDINGGFLRSFGSFGSGNGEFDLDCSGASLELYENELYVTDEGNERVQVFTPAGTYVRQWGSGGTGDQEFDRPGG